MSDKLKRFTLGHWRNLEQVNLLVPNLMEFDYQSGKTFIPFSTTNSSNLERANILVYKRGYRFFKIFELWRCGHKLVQQSS